jgi:hypothetical protein
MIITIGRIQSYDLNIDPGSSFYGSLSSLIGFIKNCRDTEDCDLISGDSYLSF